MTLTVIHSPDYAGWNLGADHPTQGRRFTAALDRMKRTDGLDLDVQAPRLASAPELERVHDPAYVAEVREGWSDEWSGRSPELGRLSALIAGGTLRGADLIWRGKVRRVFHPAGAKHHAQVNASSGFCVFNDLALASGWLTRRGLRVAVVDFDAHHGDGTESILSPNPDVLTFSVHDSTIFPGTGDTSYPEDHAYNYPLTAGSGDGDLRDALDFAGELVRAFSPDVLLVAAGADGFAEDPLSTLEYSLGSFYDAGATLSALADEVTGGRILAGGAGGYLPDDWTPACWTAFAMGLELGPRATERPNLRLVAK